MSDSPSFQVLLRIVLGSAEECPVRYIQNKFRRRQIRLKWLRVVSSARQQMRDHVAMVNIAVAERSLAHALAVYVSTLQSPHVSPLLYVASQHLACLFRRVVCRGGVVGGGVVAGEHWARYDQLLLLVVVVGRTVNHHFEPVTERYRRDMYFVLTVS